MHFNSQVTIRLPDGSLFPPIGLLHEDDDVLSGLLFLQSMGRQMAWHRNGELSGLQLQVTAPPETVSSAAVIDRAISGAAASTEDLEEVFSFLDSPACCPNSAHKP
ncbi:hypothetical protein [Cyanobium gracile]|uniref:Uncharacterized protein n=1 Tax=Cyanobium gracile (strain ATCC 27147 / PCC 6307) TaxID=292564 RepID=K9PD21_CYAGP|nr:hypothetical protein [Cyanobium gracile]AFY30424.1 hypothetical protein Cyagr_3355 [Cyanobium gracile PCC 6307]